MSNDAFQVYIFINLSKLRIKYENETLKNTIFFCPVLDGQRSDVFNFFRTSLPRLVVNLLN